MRCPDCGYLLLDPEAHCPKCEKTLVPGAPARAAQAEAASDDDDDVGDVSYPTFGTSPGSTSLSGTGSVTGSRSQSSSRTRGKTGGALSAAALAYDDDDSSDPNLPPEPQLEEQPEPAARPGLRVVDVTEQESVGETTETNFPVDLDEAMASEAAAKAEVEEEIENETTGSISDALNEALGEQSDWSGFFREIAERDELARAEAEQAEEAELAAAQVEEAEDSGNIEDAEVALTGDLDSDLAGDLSVPSMAVEAQTHEPGDITADAVEMGDEVTGSVISDPTPIPELPALLRDDVSTPRMEEEISRAGAIAEETTSGDTLITDETGMGTADTGTDPVFAAAFDALQKPAPQAELKPEPQPEQQKDITLPTGVINPGEFELEVKDRAPLEELVAGEASVDLTSKLAELDPPTDSLYATTEWEAQEPLPSRSVFDVPDLDALTGTLAEPPQIEDIPSTTPSAFDALMEEPGEATEPSVPSLTSPKQIDLEDAIARSAADEESAPPEEPAMHDDEEDFEQTLVSVRPAAAAEIDEGAEPTIVSNPFGNSWAGITGRNRTQISFPHFSVPSIPASAQALGTSHERSGDFPTADILGEASTRLSSDMLPTARTYRNKAVGRRLLAFCVDNLATLAMAGGFVLLAHLATGVGVGEARGAAGGVAATDVIIGVLVLRFFLDAFYQVSYLCLTGQTPGLRIMGLRVRAEVSRQRPSPAQALKRWLWSYWLTYGICWGFVAISRDPRGRALHDKKARTRIVPA